MRRLITFIVRLWVDAQVEPSAWEGQVECVADGKCEHIYNPEELLSFIAAHTHAPPTAAQKKHDTGQSR